MKLLRPISLVLLLCGLCFGQGEKETSAKAEPNGKSFSLKPSGVKPFGLQIGAAFSLPECEHRLLPTPTYAPGQPRWCWIDSSFVPKANPPVFTSGKFDVMIRFPASETPLITISPGFDALVENGKLQSIHFQTNGVRAVEDTLAGLGEMFGKPTHQESVKVENNVGDEFGSQNATWQFSDLVVDYQGVDGELSRGSVWMETPQAYKARMALPKKKENPLR